MGKPLCIYHGACDDGFAAAWVVRMALDGQVEFYPGVYQKDPPDVAGRDVIMVDFSYKRPVIEAMAKQAASIAIIDHHKTAAEDLSGLPPLGMNWPAVGRPIAKVTACFDMARSGAGLTWDCMIGSKRLTFIDYIEDRDLWRKSLPGSHEFTIALRSYPQDFDVWDKLIARGPAALIDEGKSIQRYYRARVEDVKRTAYRAVLGGVLCRIANAPYFLASEVAGELCEEAKFGACYFEAEYGRWQYSLRSRDDFDVSEIAKRFGGGGHKNAAGFTVDRPIHEWAGD